jgi:hypothetical protein
MGRRAMTTRKPRKTLTTWIAQRHEPNGWTVFMECHENGSEREIMRVQFPPNMTREDLQAFAEHLLTIGRQQEKIGKS